MPSKNWKLKPLVSKEFTEKFPEFSQLEAQLLYNRGLDDKNQIDDFLNPKYEGLHDPFLFQDMQKAVDRIWQAINRGEKICIYGDYDADAVTANAVLQQTFRYLGTEVESYIPDRFTEGYGINPEALQKIKDQGAKIIITVDCGTNSVDAAEFCAKNQIDLIITDHHEVIGELPKAFALINPKNSQDKYPYKEITGVGVAFKVASALLGRAPAVAKARAGEKGLGLRAKAVEGWEKWLLDLVAIGTVADCHSLLGENRILVKYGLKVLQKTKWIGLKALVTSAALDFKTKAPDAYTLGFVIAPRLNAAGRLEHANIALHLLMETDIAKAAERAAELEDINRRRQDLTARVLSEAKEAAEFIKDRKVIIIANSDWPKGIVGLVAGKIADLFGKPAMVLEKGETEATGSARTVGEFNVVEALKFSEQHLVRFGGHQQAAGLTLKTENFDVFYQKILEYAEKNLSEEDLQPHLTLEAELLASDLSLVTCHLLLKFEPFGVGNPRPKFLINAMEVVKMRAVGSTVNHLQLTLKKGSVKVAAIGFNFGYLEKSLKIGDTVDIAAELMEDGWNGRTSLKLRVVDIRNV